MLMGHTGMLDGTIVLLRDAGLGRDQFSSGYYVLLDDGFWHLLVVGVGEWIGVLC